MLFILLSSGLQAQCDSILFLGNDTTLCEGELLILDATMECATDYEWQDGNGQATRIISQEGEYAVTVTFQDSNLVVNGDFEDGNTGFDTDYTVGGGGTWGQLSDAGTYAINTNPNNTHVNFSSCGDHTSGSGNMMVVNGSTITNTVVWEQEIDVEPDMDYQMEVWLISCVSDNPGYLQFQIDGVNQGTSFSSGSTTCSWQQFTEIWNSGSNTSITFSIISLSGFAGGNDYALDDILFAGVSYEYDTIQVDVEDLAYISLGTDTLLCDGQVMTLDAYIDTATYLWQDGSDISFHNVIQGGDNTGWK